MDAKVIDVYLMQSHSLSLSSLNLIYLLNEPAATLSAPQGPWGHRTKRSLGRCPITCGIGSAESLANCILAGAGHVIICDGAHRWPRPSWPYLRPVAR